MTVLIAITGGSGSGKSTLAAALAAALRPGSTAVLSEDWYYRDLSAEPGFDPQTVDFDDLGVRDHALLIDHLKALRAGRGVLTPRYCFIRHLREPQGVWLAPSEAVILEGSHLLCREDLASLFDLRIFLDTPADIRLLRRLIRDQSQRGRSQSSIIDQYMRTVRPAYERLTGPSSAHAHYVLQDRTEALQAPRPEALHALLAPVLLDDRIAALRI